jgi:truncated hemoglobin YjbI
MKAMRRRLWVTKIGNGLQPSWLAAMAGLALDRMAQTAARRKTFLQAKVGLIVGWLSLQSRAKMKGKDEGVTRDQVFL